MDVEFDYLGTACHNHALIQAIQRHHFRPGQDRPGQMAPTVSHGRA